MVANYGAAPDLAARRPFTLNRTVITSFEPLTPGCSRKVDLAMDQAHRTNKLKIQVSGTVGGRQRRDTDNFTYR